MMKENFLVATGLPSRKVQPDIVLDAVARAFDVPLEVLSTAGRRRDPQEARAAAIILLADLCDLPSPQIGRLVGDCPMDEVTEAIGRKDRLFLDPVWTGFLGDAVEDMTGVRPAEPAPILAYQGYPVRALESHDRTVLLEFIGRPPPGFAQAARISRDMLRPAPDLSAAAQALEDFLVWARPLIATGLAWPELTRHVGVAEHALSTLLRETLPPD